MESLSLSVDAILDCYATETLHGLPAIPLLSLLDIGDKQRSDPSMREVIHQMEMDEKVPQTMRHGHPKVALLLREWNRLEFRDGVLYRRRQDDEQVSFQLVLPGELQPTLLTSLHATWIIQVERTFDPLLLASNGSRCGGQG